MKNQGIRSASSQEKADCLMELFQTVYGLDQGALSHTILMMGMSDEAITEKRVRDSLKQTEG